MESSCLFGLIEAPVENHFLIGLMVGASAGMVISLVADYISLHFSSSKGVHHGEKTQKEQR